jgi:isoleucyl-tRNA synthetase
MAEALLKSWEDVRQFREIVTPKIEEKRVAKELGSSLQAELDVTASGATYDALARLGDDLRFVLITSRATLHRAEGAPAVDAKPSKMPKCDRCWHYRADVNGEGLCGRCVSNLKGPGESRRFA